MVYFGSNELKDTNEPSLLLLMSADMFVFSFHYFVHLSTQIGLTL